LGFWDEWALKAPSMLAALVTFLAIAWIGGRLFTSIAGEDATALGWCAAAAWCATPDAIKHMYFLRPDMTLIACMTVGWAAAVASLQRAAEGLPRFAANAVFWLCVGLAALAKGQFALILVLLLPLTAWTWFGSLKHARGAGWWWGFPFACALFALWFVPALMAQPDFMIHELLGTEVATRLGIGANLTWRLMAPVRLLGFFLERFAPFALAAGAALLVWRVRDLRRLGIMPAAVMLVAIFAILALLGLASGSFAAPAYPAAAILGVAFLYWWRGKDRLLWIVTAALISALAITVLSWNFDRGARSGKGDAIVAFSREARAIVGSQGVIFGDLGYSAVPTLMGRHQAGRPSPQQVAIAEYAVLNLDATAAKPIVKAHSSDGKWGIGLFKAEEVLDVFNRSPDTETAPKR
jgi:4-amino-4-deoxy-L-arabinose transferase-like glycosyltransferase